jgi:hypothetical protein
VNSAELIEALRIDAFITSAFTDFSDARCLVELNNAMTQTFERAVAQARSGYWLKQSTQAVTPGRGKYRIPYRAVTGGLEQVALADTDGKFLKLEEVSETHAQVYESANNEQGTVAKYVVRGDQVVLLATPSSAMTLRWSYYVRPSRLVTPQTAGVVTSVNTAARTLTVNSVPLNQEGTPFAIASGSLIDIVHPGGWYELALVGAPVTIAGVTLTIGGTAPMDEIETGDFVRAAEQTDWPCLPEDFHRCLADVAAVKVMTSLNMIGKAGALASQLGADISRFNDLLVSRVKSEAKVLKPPRSILQVGRSSRSWFGWR